MDYSDIIRLNKTLKEAERSCMLAEALGEQAKIHAQNAGNLIRIAEALLSEIRPS
ncbi:MAG: hypothetical protein IKL81_05090 [Clostridia bacterium]|nr:hypothetical protein [Clostridia bacterium]